MLKLIKANLCLSLNWLQSLSGDIYLMKVEIKNLKKKKKNKTQQLLKSFSQFHLSG